MYRTNRFALAAAVLLLVVLAGTTLATRSPVADENAAPQADDPEAPDAEGVTHARERLAAAGIEADAALVEELAAEYGVGGAVRILAWSSEIDVPVADIRARRAEGKGWGVIARELGVHPGIGSVMGQGGGHGRENAPGQQKRGDDAEDDAADD